MLIVRVLLVALAICFLGYAKAWNGDSDYWDNFGDNLSRSINGQVQGSLKGLDNLGATISQQVYQGLKPVRQMETRFRIKFGNDGITIATFKDKQFIVRNGVMYECDGTTSEADGSCSGTLSKASFQDKKDYCYANTNTIINNWYCISNGNVNSGVINNKIYCKSADDSPTLLIPVREYNDLCGSESKTVTYKYFTNKPIGEHSPDVKCSGSTPIICTMAETRNANIANIESGGTLVIN